MSDLKEFLPAQPIPGRIGFYPCLDKAEWHALPLPMRVITWHVPIKEVEFESWFDNYGIKAQVRVDRGHAHKCLFMSHGDGTQLYKLSAVIHQDGSREAASWRQDMRTGAFAIYSIGGRLLARQGGYSGHLPANVYKDQAGSWKIDSGKPGPYTELADF